jgi:hypothetical protein
MRQCALASADVVRLPLPDGHFITVKKELNAGEAVDLEYVTGNRTFPAVLAYLVGWSLVGFDETPIPYSPMQSVDERLSTLRALKASTFNAITTALLPHMRQSRQDIDEKKTIPEPAPA